MPALVLLLTRGAKARRGFVVWTPRVSGGLAVEAHGQQKDSGHVGFFGRHRHDDLQQRKTDAQGLEKPSRSAVYARPTGSSLPTQRAIF